jgi:cytidylate kinase
VTVVAIDGPGGSGKSTVAAALASRLGLEWLDTGAMYRAVALAALRRGIAPGDGEALAAVTRGLHMEMGPRVLLDGEDVTAAIRGHDVDAVVSSVASHRGVREELVGRQREWVAARGSAVVEGRDITSVVLPDADLKVYLTAEPAERALRRAGEHAGGVPAHAQVAATGEAIERRDRLDAGRTHSPLVVAEGAVVVDSTKRSVAEVVDEIVALL